MIKRFYGIGVIVSLFFLVMMRCSLPEINSPYLNNCTVPNGNETMYKFKKRYFVLVPSDTALVSGTSICTLITNGTMDMIITDSCYFRTITLKDTTLIINDRPYTVTPQMYQYGTSLAASALTNYKRFFKNNDTAVLQLACEAGHGITYTDQRVQKVIPVSIEMGSFDTVTSSNNKWQTFPLIPLGEFSDAYSSQCIGFTVATSAIAIYPMTSYLVNGFRYSDGVSLKSYYVVFYEETTASTVYTIQRKVTMLRNYFKDVGLVEQYISIVTQRLGTDGTVVITKKHYAFKRGPEGAPKYKDWQ